MVRFLFVLLMLVAAAPPEPGPPPLPSPAAPDAEPPLRDPFAVLEALDARADALPSLRYGAVRVTTRNQTRVEERWRFAWRADGAFRVDYAGDTVRQVVCDGEVLWDYVPARGAARRVDLARLDPAERARMLQAVLEKVAVPGFRAGAVREGFSWVYEEHSDPGQVAIRGTDAAGGDLYFLLGADGAWISESTIRQEGRFVVSIKASRHREVAPGTWFPTRIEMLAPEAGGEVRVEMDLQQPTAGESLAPELFTLNLDPSVKVESVP